MHGLRGVRRESPLSDEAGEISRHVITILLQFPACDNH